MRQKKKKKSLLLFPNFHIPVPYTNHRWCAVIRGCPAQTESGDKLGWNPAYIEVHALPVEHVPVPVRWGLSTQGHPFPTHISGSPTPLQPAEVWPPSSAGCGGTTRTAGSRQALGNADTRYNRTCLTASRGGSHRHLLWSHLSGIRREQAPLEWSLWLP